MAFSFKLDWGSYIISIGKTASNKIGALIHAMKFCSMLCISINLPYTHVWNTVAMSRLVPPVATWNYYTNYKNKICRIVGPSLAASPEPLAHHWNVVTLSLFYRCYFGRCSSELTQLVPLPFSPGRSTSYSDRLHDFSVTIPRCFKDIYLNSFFAYTARLWNSRLMECFPLTYDLLSGFKSRINRHLLTVGSLRDFLYSSTLICLL